MWNVVINNIKIQFEPNYNFVFLLKYLYRNTI